jgi:hypothetical protein
MNMEGADARKYGQEGGGSPLAAALVTYLIGHLIGVNIGG